AREGMRVRIPLRALPGRRLRLVEGCARSKASAGQRLRPRTERRRRLPITSTAPLTTETSPVSTYVEGCDEPGNPSALPVTVKTSSRFDPVTCTVWMPGSVPAGSVTEPVNVPSAPLTTVPTGTPSNVTVSVSPGAHPDPRNAIWSPTWTVGVPTTMPPELP